MIDIVPSPDQVVAVRASGKVDRDEWRQATQAVDEALDRHEKIAVYADLTDMDAATVGAIVEDVTFSLKNVTDLNRFSKAAVVTDARWTKKATEASEKLVPGLETRVFSRGQENVALQWASS